MSQDFMETAIELACKNIDNEGGPFGAVVVRDGIIVGRGQNRVTAGNDPTAHAEVMAIRDACRTLQTFDLSGCEIYSSCEPCPMCLGAVYWARLDALWYGATRYDAAAAGFDDEFIYEELDRTAEQRNLKIRSIGKDAVRPFRLWLEKTDKTPY